MFCPKCSRQQIYDDIRFCSGCGFQLNVVKALLVADEASFPKTSEPATVARSRRIKDMTIGAILMCVFALHTAWTTEDLSLDREYTSLIFKCFILCLLIKIMPLIRVFFSPRDSTSSNNLFSRFTATFKQPEQNHALPPADDRPGADYFTARTKTAEFVPPSITEHTTNLLRNN